MKVTRTIVALAATMSLALGLTPSHALDGTCSILGGSADTPHVEDVKGDQMEPTTQVPTPDGTDVLGGWLARDENGVVTANLSVGSLNGTETNYVYYFRWTFRGSDPSTKELRWVSIQPRPDAPAGSPVAYGARYRYGYLDTTTPGLQTLVYAGDSTGTVTNGTPGTISVNLYAVCGAGTCA